MKKFSCIIVTLLVLAVSPAIQSFALTSYLPENGTAKNPEMEIIPGKNVQAELLTYNMFPNLYVLIYEIKPQVAFTTPWAEEKKKRDVLRDFFLDFPVTPTKIYPECRENRIDPMRIEQFLKKISEDIHFTGKEVHMNGYASPEGSKAMNLNLSNGKRLEVLVDNSDIMYCDEIPEMTGKDHEAGIRKKQIAALDEDRVYRNLLHGFYPRWDSKEFRITKGKEKICYHPSPVSLQEKVLIGPSLYGELWYGKTGEEIINS